MALNSQNTNSRTPPLTQTPRGIPCPPPTRRPLPPLPPLFLFPKMPFKLSCSLRMTSSSSGRHCLPPRLSPPPRLPPPQGSWLFELLPPPGSFHAIAFSVVKNRETAQVGPPADTIIRASYSKCRPLREPRPASIIAKYVARGRRRAASPRV